MSNSKMISMFVASLSLTGCLGSSGGSTTTSAAPVAANPALANLQQVLADAGCTVATVSGGVQFTCGSASATVQNGTNGATGATGSTGATGAIGAQGSQGIQGVSGPSGAVGATGPAGVTGPAGAGGPTGATGATGAVGAAGATGAAGAGGFNVLDGTGGALGTAVSSIGYNGAMVYNATQGYIAVYQANYGTGNAGRDQYAAYLTTVQTLYYSGAGCTGSVYSNTFFLHAMNEIFVFDPNHAGTSTYYKTTGVAVTSVVSLSFQSTPGVCQTGTQTLTNVFPVAVTAETAPLWAALPLQFEVQ